jgi:hypothetical protein
MKRLVYIIAFMALAVSCDRNEGPVYDVNNGQAMAAFNRNVQTFPVDDSGNSFTEIIVGVTTVSDVDRSVTVSVDPASTADPSEYTIDPASLVIPAGEFVARVRLVGNFNNIPETGQTNVILNLDSVEGAILDDPVTGRLSHRVNLFRFCPFTNGSNFLGAYELTTVTTGIFGVETFIGGTVTLEQGATVADRQFSAGLYAAFGGFGPYTWNFSLICGEVIVPGEVNTGVGCGGSIRIGPGSTAATYDGSDDSSFTINYIDDVDGAGGCGGPVEVTILLTKL